MYRLACIEPPGECPNSSAQYRTSTYGICGETKRRRDMRDYRRFEWIFNTLMRNNSDESMNDVHSQIEEMVHRETRAWNALDAEALVNLFHPDMVWPWPPTEHAHDPIEWVMVLGRYDRTRWMKLWQGLFDTHELIR